MHPHSTSRFPLATALLLALLAGSSTQAQVINEVVANHTGTDDHEFLEVFGDPSTDYSNLTLLQLEGDAGSAPGLVDSALTVGTTSASGHWFTGFLNSQLDNGTATFLLVDSFTGTVGADLDTDDDGVLDITPWTAILDSVAINDGDVDFEYSTVVLTPGFDGVSFTPGGASRIPDGTDSDSVGDWVRNDFDGAGLPGFGGTLESGEALNTPDVANSTTLAPSGPAQISEVVLDHLGEDTHEFLEIFGEPAVDYSASTLLVVDADANPGEILSALPAGMTGSNGFFATAFLSEQLPNSGATVLLVESFSGTTGMDLDTNDDGTLELTPWAAIEDSVALADPAAGDVVYSTTVLTPTFDGGSTLPGGASRYPYGIDTDAPGDWRRNDFDGAGLPGFGGGLESGESFNSPGEVNIVGADDYYASVDTGSAVLLRSTLHDALDDHVRFPYSSSEVDTWDVLELADEDPTDSGSILDVYRNASYAKEGGGNSNYNREHTWPRSYGFPDDGPENYPYTDCHQLFLSDIGYNSDRSNLAFGNCNAGCSEDPTLANGGQGGGSGSYPGNSNWFTGSGGSGIWETWSGRKGELARAQLYLDLRYEGGLHGVTGAAEPDLILTDDTSLIQTTGTNAPTAFMGRLATLLAWHEADPVTEGERLRNEVVYRFQGNRNPFVDHPEWVACLFSGASCNNGIFADGFESGDTTSWTLTVGAP